MGTNWFRDLEQIITELGGAASLKDISDEISKKYEMVIFDSHLIAIESILKHNKNIFEFDGNVWKLKIVNTKVEDRKLSKKELAISMGNIDSNNVNYSKFNNNFYWLNPSEKVLKDDWWIVLDYPVIKAFYIFCVPKGTFSSYNFVVRDDQSRNRALEIKIKNDSDFLDSRSGVKFRKYLLKTIRYR